MCIFIAFFYKKGHGFLGVWCIRTWVIFFNLWLFRCAAEKDGYSRKQGTGLNNCVRAPFLARYCIKEVPTCYSDFRAIIQQHIKTCEGTLTKAKLNHSIQ